MKKIITLRKKEDYYFMTVCVDGNLLVTGNVNELPRVHNYKEFKKSKGWITVNEIDIDFDELIIE